MFIAEKVDGMQGDVACKAYEGYEEVLRDGVGRFLLFLHILRLMLTFFGVGNQNVDVVYVGERRLPSVLLPSLISLSVGLA